MLCLKVQAEHCLAAQHPLSSKVQCLLRDEFCLSSFWHTIQARHSQPLPQPRGISCGYWDFERHPTSQVHRASAMKNQSFGKSSQPHTRCHESRTDGATKMLVSETISMWLMRKEGSCNCAAPRRLRVGKLSILAVILRTLLLFEQESDNCSWSKPRLFSGLDVKHEWAPPP